MATGNQLMQEIYDQFLICKICYDTYKRPKTLACLHIFCTDCLEKHMDAEMDRSYRYMLYSRAITCPICRKKTEMPSGGIKRLPDNFLVENLTEILSRRKRASKLPLCEICQPSHHATIRPASSKCLDCSKLLCYRCVELHKRTKVTIGHSLIDVEVEKDIQCKVHSDEVVRFYCEPCEICICVVCTFQEHKGHEVSSFRDGMQKYKNSLDSLVQACRERIGELRDRLELMQKCEAVLNRAEERIKDTAQQSISVIRKKEQQMIEDLHKVYGEEALDYLRGKPTLQALLDNLVSTTNLTDIVLKDKGVELLLLRREIQDKLEMLLQRNLLSPFHPNLLKQVQFVPGSLVFGYLEVDGIGGKGMQCADSGMICDMTSSGCDAIMQTEDDWKGSRMCESQTMTEGVQVMKRKTQTDKVISLDKEISTMKVLTSERPTNTDTPVTCDRSCLTIQKILLDQLTDTQDLINLTDRLIGTTAITVVNMSTLTERVATHNRGTEMDRPFHADKMTLTPRVTQRDKDTCTPSVHVLDMGSDAIRWHQTNKAINTKTIVTKDMSVGDHVAETVSQGTGTMVQDMVKGDSQGTTHGAAMFTDRASSPFLLDPFVGSKTRPRAQIGFAQPGGTVDGMDRMLLTQSEHRPVPLRQTPSDSLVPFHSELAISADHLLTDSVQTVDADMQTELSLVLHKLDPQQVRVSFQDNSTTMSSRVLVGDKCSETNYVKQIDKKCGTSNRETKESAGNLANASSSMGIDDMTSGDQDSSVRVPVMVTSGEQDSSVRVPVMEEAVRIPQRRPSYELVNSETNTRRVFLEERGMTAPSIMMLTKNTNTVATGTRTIGTTTFVQTIEKATYMPHPVIISTGTSTPLPNTLDKKISTIPVETREWSSMTPVVKTWDKETGVDKSLTSTKGTSTIKVILKDREVDVYRGEQADCSTFTPKIIMRTTGTEMPTLKYHSAGTCTPSVRTVDRDTAMPVVNMIDFGVTIKPECVDVGILKRPHTLSRGMSTKRIKMFSSEGGIEIPFDDGELGRRTLDGSADKQSFTDRGSSPIPVAVTHRQCSPVGFADHHKEISAIASMEERGSQTRRPETASACTGTRPLYLTNRESSPIRIPCRNMSTSMPKIKYRDRNTSPERIKTSTVGTATLEVVLMERRSSPIHFATSHKGISVNVAMADKEVDAFRLPTREKCTSTFRILSVEQGTYMQPTVFLEKETSTPPIHYMHKNVSTENVNTEDKQTSTVDHDVAAAYRDLVAPRVFPIPTITRGTCTPLVLYENKHTSTPKELMVEKSTSPLRVIKLDKAVGVTKGEILEPRDKFHRPGEVRKILKSDGEEEEVFIPSLASIREDSKEWSSSDEDIPSGGHTHRNVGVGTTCDDELGLVHTEKMWSSGPNTKPGSSTVSTFSANGSFGSSSIRCQVEAGTSTPPIEMEDKCVSTESFAVDNSLAECISKLKNVRQRLETPPSSVSPPTSIVPIYSKTNIKEINPSATEGTVSIGTTRRLGTAETKVTTVLSRSKSVGDDSILEFSARSGPLPFLTPPATRRELGTPVASISEEKEDDMSLLRASKARKQKLDITQLLKSASLSERSNTQPFIMSKPRLQTVHSQVIPPMEACRSESRSPKQRRRRTRSRSHGKGEEDSPPSSGPPSLEGTRVRRLSESSEGAMSSPERLKEHLRSLAPLPENIVARPTRAERIKERRSRAEKHRERLEKQANFDELRGLPPGHSILSSIRSKPVEIAPPSYKPGSAPGPRYSPRVTRRVRKPVPTPPTITSPLDTSTSTSCSATPETTDLSELGDLGEPEGQEEPWLRQDPPDGAESKTVVSPGAHRKKLSKMSSL